MSTQLPSAVNPPRRVLMGPGPSDIAPRVLAALAVWLIGYDWKEPERPAVAAAA